MKPHRNMFFRCTIALALSSSLVATDPTASIAIATSPPQREQGNWSLVDIDGNDHVPFDRPETKAIVLVFISTDCPIANSYQPSLARLVQQHPSPGVAWFMIHVDSDLTVEQAREHAQRFGIQVPVVIDHDRSIARRAGATVTPQVFVYQKGNAPPVYQGRIDDWYADFGKKRASPTTRELADALEAIAKGEPVAVAQTEAVGCFITFQETAAPTDAIYDPLKVEAAEIEQALWTVEDKKRSRDIPIRVYLPPQGQAAPVVLFSHGLGGNRDNSAYLGNHWAARGYVAVFMQHRGSDDSVWKGAPLSGRIDALRDAANGENFKLRVDDVHAVIDQLESWNQENGHPLNGRLDLSRIGMSGHSFGAVTTQAVSGQSYLRRQLFTDPRIKAAVAMSPSAPPGLSAARTFGQVRIPWLLMTGTDDVALIGNADVESRLAVFPALPDGGKYELVLDKAEHSAFSDRALPGDQQRRNPNHHRAILAASTAFWDAYLKDDAAAKSWLDGDAIKKILEPGDRWQAK